MKDLNENLLRLIEDLTENKPDNTNLYVSGLVLTPLQGNLELSSNLEMMAEELGEVGEVQKGKKDDDAPKSFTSEEMSKKLRNIKGAKNYIILEGKNHDHYSYPDMVVSPNIEHLGRSWDQCKTLLNSSKQQMMTLRQILDFYNLINSEKGIYNAKGEQLSNIEVMTIKMSLLAKSKKQAGEWADNFFFYGNETTIRMEFPRKLRLGGIKNKVSIDMKLFPKNVLIYTTFERLINSLNSYGLPDLIFPQGTGAVFILPDLATIKLNQYGCVAIVGSVNNYNCINCNAHKNNAPELVGVRPAYYI